MSNDTLEISTKGIRFPTSCMNIPIKAALILPIRGTMGEAPTSVMNMAIYMIDVYGPIKSGFSMTYSM